MRLGPDLSASQKVGGLLIKLSFPSMLGMVVYSLFNLIDTFFVARLGADALAALILTIPAQILITSLASATGTGITSLISRTLGSGNIKQADNIAWHGIIISLVYGLAFLLTGNELLDKLLMIFGCNPDTYAQCSDYLQVILNGSAVIFILIILNNIIQGEGDTLLPMLVSLGGIILNVIFDPLLIFGVGPIPAMGMKGAALATILSEFISLIILIKIIIGRRAYLTWKPANFRISLGIIYGIYQVGFPSLIMELVAVFIMIFINRVVVAYSTTAVVVLGIFHQVRSLFYMPVYGLAQGAMPIAAFAWGSGNPDRVKETMMKASAAALMILAAATVVMQGFPGWIMGFFTSDPETIKMGIQSMHLATIFLPMMGPIIILFTVLQSLGKGFSAMWLSLWRQLGIFFPCLLIFPQIFGFNGIWLAYSLSELLSGILALYFIIKLWGELQLRKQTALLMLFRLGYGFKRLIAWLRFN